jgi:hypothetical protein
MKEVCFTAILSQFESSALWGWHFLVPNDVATSFVEGKNRRVVCTLNGHLVLHCALMPNKDTWFIMLNADVQKKLKAPLHTSIEVHLAKDNSQYGMPMPEEFQEVLSQDPMADAHFQALTPGKQRSLIYIISKVKNTDSRIRKSLAIADHLTANNGEIHSKLLYEALKTYNKM